ncbi:MAG: GAF domain-containing protein [Calditrichaeota bacterium]|nr:MAG: GAF domain-containing protein [Calditrichota bacterium]MBL1206519.1 GAF domain-containing protein [Calditrichota bacterium]NOG46347.1 sigma 54-interacting transcriptional regulator [Calditrichota bacterium]
MPDKINFTSSLKSLRELTTEQYNVLYQVTRLLNAPEMHERLIEEALDLVVSGINAERGLFVRYLDKSNDFQVIAAQNVLKEQMKDVSHFSSGVLQEVISKREACLYHDVQNDPHISQFESIQIQQIKSIIGVPVFYGEAIWGVILVDSIKNRQEFTDENMEFLHFFSSLISLGLNRIEHLEKLQTENLQLRNQLEAYQNIPQMIGESAAMKKFSAMIHRVAQTNATVLITGESGTGKDLAARAIHTLSQRKDQSYIAQFCGSIPDTLLESELFGYKKGAFTGATTDKKGLFEVADNGTFFLDEIADISMALQAKLLRVIENQEIIRLGATEFKKVDVRLIAATNKNLKELSKTGHFREDLFYRLNVFPIKIPSLRERSGDIALLARFFIQKHSKSNITLSTEALKTLESYNWPGNVRQLENTIQRALILCDSDKIYNEHIVIEDEDKKFDEYGGTLRELEKQILLKRLDKFNGNRTHTAESLGVSVRWIQKQLKKFEENES